MKVLREKFDKVAKEVKEIDESDSVEKEDELAHYVVEVELEARCHVLVSHDDRDRVDATTGNDFVDTVRAADRFDQELHCLLEGLLIMSKEDISVIAKKQAKSVLK